MPEIKKEKYKAAALMLIFIQIAQILFCLINYFKIKYQVDSSVIPEAPIINLAAVPKHMGFVTSGTMLLSFILFLYGWYRISIAISILAVIAIWVLDFYHYL